jgi:DNA-binding HxlR family transcriptional regulator
VSDAQKISYRMILIIGLLYTHDNEGVQTDKLATYLQDKIGLTRKMTLHDSLQELQDVKMVVKIPSRKKREKGARFPSTYKLTDKGKRYAEEFKFYVFVDNPPLVSIEDYV